MIFLKCRKGCEWQGCRFEADVEQEEVARRYHEEHTEKTAKPQTRKSLFSRLFSTQEELEEVETPIDLTQLQGLDEAAPESLSEEEPETQMLEPEQPEEEPETQMPEPEQPSNFVRSLSNLVRKGVFSMLWIWRWKPFSGP